MRNFIIGLSFGIVAGLLLAPKRGELIRADLRRRARKAAANVGNASRHSARKSVQSVAPADEKDHATDTLNSAAREALIAVHGIGEVLAGRIIDNRPYARAYDVVEKGILPECTFIQLKKELLEKSA
jgi:DNA uptake protein ComE-like DNA-binding protein